LFSGFPNFGAWQFKLQVFVDISAKNPFGQAFKQLLLRVKYELLHEMQSWAVPPLQETQESWHLLHSQSVFSPYMGASIVDVHSDLQIFKSPTTSPKVEFGHFVTHFRLIGS